MAYEPQIIAANAIIDNFDVFNYVMLLAQMQSGKTGTFMLVICEMIRTGMVGYGVIFSGNRETDLKEQTERNMVEFLDTYAEYLTTKGIHDHSVIDRIKNGDLIKIVWGPDLKKFTSLGNTIYVWEESHFGQTKDQEIDKFITKLGIDPTGNSVPDGCYVLSVSATPFSEYVDFQTLEQNKCVVRLNPPESYLSVRKLLTNNQIHTYTQTPKAQFIECLLNNPHKGYAIVRGMAGDLAPIAIHHGWDVVYYNQANQIDINKLLSVRPERPTVIFLKGMIRMGKQLQKKFLMFCLETSRTFKTDALLQGLIGRCCGYDSHGGIHIYVRRIEGVIKSPIMVVKHGKQVHRKKRMPSGKMKKCWMIEKVDKILEEIERFISLHENEELETSPFRGTNMTGSEQSIDQIPVKVMFNKKEWDKLLDTYDPESGYALISTSTLRKLLIKKSDKGLMLNQNTTTEHDVTRILHLDTPLIVHYTHKKNGKENKIMTREDPVSKKTPMQSIVHAYDNGEKLRLGFGYGVRLNELFIFPDIKNKCVYVTYCVPSKIGNTTKREVFAKKSLPTIYTSGGKFTVHIPSTIAVDADSFISVISECVTIYRGANQLIVPSFISPLKMGIFLNKDIFDKIQPGKEIHSALLALGIVISYKKAPGSNPVGMDGVRLSRISWTLTDDVEYLPIAVPCEPLVEPNVICDAKQPNPTCVVDEDVPMIMAVYTEMESIVITPISKTYKPAGTPDSRRNYENQLARVVEGNEWMWDDAKGNKSVKGGILGFVFNNSHIEFRRITRTADPSERLPLWAANVGHGDRQVLFLGETVHTMQWDEWRALGGMPKVQGTTYPRNMDIAALTRILSKDI